MSVSAPNIGLEITKAEFLQLSLSDFLSHWKNCAYLNQSERCLAETQTRLDILKNPQEELQLRFILAKSYYLNGRFEDAVEQMNLVLDRADSADDLFIQALIEKAYILHNKQPYSCFELLQRAQEEIAKRPDKNLRVEGDLQFQFGIYFEFQGQFQRASEYYHKAMRSFHRAGETGDELMSAYNALTMEYNLGRTAVALTQLEELEQRCRRHSCEYVLDFCRHLRGSHALGQGSFQKGIEIFKSALTKNPDDYSSKDGKFVKKIILGYFKAGQFQEAMQWLTLTGTIESISRDVEMRTLFVEMRESLNLFLNQSFSEATSPFAKKKFASLNDRNRVLLLLFNLELNWRSNFAIDVQRLLPSFELTSIEAVDFDSIVRLKFLLGLHYLFYGQIRKAEEQLSASLRLSQQLSYSLFEYRNLMGLALIDLSFNRSALALSKILRARQIETQFDPSSDLHLCQALKAVVHLKLGEMPDFQSCLNEIPQQSPYAFLKYFLSRLLPTPEPQLPPPINELEKKYLDSLVRYMGIEAARTFVVKTATGSTSYFEHELPSFSRQDFEIVVDDYLGKIRVGMNFISYAKRPVLQNMLRLFLESAGRGFSKEELATYVWNENYNPLIHDTRIYTSIKRLRDDIEPLLRKDFIVTEKGNYIVPRHIRFALITVPTLFDHLNERQKWAMRFIQSHGWIDRSTAQSMLKISPSLAKQELRQLMNRALIEPVGKGKSTIYRLAKNSVPL